MHGGTVAAESGGLGRGSTFSVRLPLAGRRIEVGTKAESADLCRAKRMPAS